MNIKEFDEKYGKKTLVGAVLLIWSLIILSFFTRGYIETWYLWNFPAKMPPFSDFRLIPSSIETLRAGGDAALSNPADPRGHIFNYPKIWYLLLYTGITQNDTIWICTVLIVLFFLVVLAFPEKPRVRDTVLLLAVAFSPACMLL